MSRGIAIPATLAIAVSISIVAHAMMWKETTVAELSSAADVIVLGSVQSQESEWNLERSFIWTYVNFKVDEVYKSNNRVDKDSEIVVRVEGGNVDGITQSSANDVIFSREEKAILFLNESGDDPNLYELVNAGQGKMSIVGRTVSAHPSVEGIADMNVRSVTDAIAKSLEH